MADLLRSVAQSTIIFTRGCGLFRSGIARTCTRFYAGNALKKDTQDSAQPAFWSQRYISGRTPWQLDHLPARLDAFIRLLPAKRNVLIPGCGQDYRTVDVFRNAGHRVTAIDFSPIAVESTNKALRKTGTKVILGDFFNYDFKSAPFEIIYERTFLCSLPPSLWKSYATRVAQLLSPGGTLAGFFFYGKESDPPPYPLTESKAVEIFGPQFKLKKSEPVTDSLSIFAGKERWQEWQLRER